MGSLKNKKVFGKVPVYGVKGPRLWGEIRKVIGARLWPFFPKLEIKENGSQMRALLKGV
jgi:hypothetical protein